MSNLSELLPTGGGQNAVDFVASGTLASGQTVALKTDGTVEAVASSADSFGSAVIFNAGSTAYAYIGVTYDSNSNKIVIAYRDEANSNYGTAVVGTVSGTSISFGTAVAFSSSTAAFMTLTFDSNLNKVVIAYQDVGNSNYGTAIVGTVSGTSISFGSAAVFSSGATYFPSITFDSSNNKVVIAFRNGSNSNYGGSCVATVSGTSISFGTIAYFNSALANYVAATFDSSSNKVVIGYYDGGTGYGAAIVATVSGTSISYGTSVSINSTAIYFTAITFDSSSNKVVIAFKNGSLKASGIVGTVSGTAISFGTAVDFVTNTDGPITITFDSTANKVVISYRDNSNSNYGTSIVGTVNGTALSFGTPIVFNLYETGISIVSTYDSTANKVVVVYCDQNNSNYGTSKIFTVGSSNNTSFIGIASEAISNTATGAINVYGGINTAQTGLTIASDYYVQTDGSLSTTTSTVKAGQAISATTINMKDLT